MEDSAVYRTGLVGLALLFVAVGLSVSMTGVAAAQSTGFVDVEANNLAGSGTSDDPYIITNASELQAMEDDLDANYELTEDTDASATAQWNNKAGFDPVEQFTGSLDGSGRTISGLTINRTDKSDVGLFGDNEGKVSNLSLTNLTVTGDRDVGGLVGENNGGNITNVTIDGNVTGNSNVGGLVGKIKKGAVIHSYTSTDVSGSSIDIGGLVGENSRESTINGSYATGNVTGNSTDVGGLVGRNIGNIINSYATGDINPNENNPQFRPGDRVGGLTGYNQGNIMNSYATGTVTGDTRVGGLVGVNFDYNATETVVRNSYATGDVTGTGVSVGGLIGSNFEGAPVGDLVPSLDIRVTNSYATGDVTGEGRFVGGFIGYNNGTISQSFAIGNVTGNGSDVGGFAGDNREVIRDSYWDTDATGQANSAGNATGLNTAQMTGSAAQDSMSALDLDTVWNIQLGDYPILMHQADDTTDESNSVQVQLSNISLTPQTVDSGSESTHQLTFKARNVSADGSKDNFDITFPDKVELVNYSDVEIDEKSSGVDMIANTLEFSVNATGGGSTQISGDLNVTVSATN